MEKVIIEIEYEIEGEGRENPGEEILAHYFSFSSVVLGDKYDIVIHSMEVLEK